MENSDQTQNTTMLRRRATLMLLTTAIIWGSGFIPQKIGSNTLSPYAFNGIRYLLAALMVLTFARFKLPQGKTERGLTILAGVNLFIAANLQQLGIKHTTIGNAGFITTTYIALVPFLSFLIFRKKIVKKDYLAALLALAGLYLLTTSGKALDKISIGDGIIFIGSVFWALHILVVGQATSRTDPVQFSAGQFLVCAFLNLVTWLIFGGTPLKAVVDALPILLYSGFVVIGMGFTLQAIGQKHAGESQAAIILGLEAVFASLFGLVIFKESYTLTQVIGAALIFFSVILSVNSGKD